MHRSTIAARTLTASTRRAASRVNASRVSRIPIQTIRIKLDVSATRARAVIATTAANAASKTAERHASTLDDLITCSASTNVIVQLPGKLQRIHLRARRRSNRRGGRGLSRRHYHHRFNAGDAMHVEPALAPEPGQGDEPSVHGSAEDDAVRCHDAGQTALGSVRRGDGQCAQLIRGKYSNSFFFHWTHRLTDTERRLITDTSSLVSACHSISNPSNRPTTIRAPRHCSRVRRRPSLRRHSHLRHRRSRLETNLSCGNRPRCPSRLSPTRLRE